MCYIHSCNPLWAQATIGFGKRAPLAGETTHVRGLRGLSLFVPDFLLLVCLLTCLLISLCISLLVGRATDNIRGYPQPKSQGGYHSVSMLASSAGRQTNWEVAMVVGTWRCWWRLLTLQTWWFPGNDYLDLHGSYHDVCFWVLHCLRFFFGFKLAWFDSGSFRSRIGDHTSLVMLMHFPTPSRGSVCRCSNHCCFMESHPLVAVRPLPADIIVMNSQEEER